VLNSRAPARPQENKSGSSLGRARVGLGQDLTRKAKKKNKKIGGACLESSLSFVLYGKPGPDFFAFFLCFSKSSTSLPSSLSLNLSVCLVVKESQALLEMRTRSTRSEKRFWKFTPLSGGERVGGLGKSELWRKRNVAKRSFFRCSM